MSEGRLNTRSNKLVNQMARLQNSVMLASTFDAMPAQECSWDVDCSIEEPPDDEEANQRKARVVGDVQERAFVVRDDAGDEDDLLGDPDDDLDVSDDETQHAC